MKKTKKRSPLKDKPLRNPGQSLDEEIQRIVDDKFNSYVLVSSMFMAVALHEWIVWSTHAPPQPVIFTTIAIAVIIYSGIRIYRLRKRVLRLRQGRDGEKAVGQYLENLRASGCIVFHDIIGDGYNIDHVVLSRKGIYAVETKTYSKPSRGKAEVGFQDGELKIDNYKTDGSIITQARAEAGDVANILKASTGRQYPVKPVVVFPGWYVNPDVNKNMQDVWVLNPKALPGFIENQAQSLTQEDVQIAAYHLSRHIRSM